MATKFHFLNKIEEIKPLLKPPVSNSMLFNDELQFMIVGGPNQRKDYHTQMGEELFYQVVGDMDLVIVNPKTQQQEPIRIKEGEVFLLPAGVSHSPQRYANTIGLVFERKRLPTEMDNLRWHLDADPSSTPATTEAEEKAQVLYEEYFHCLDLGSEIKQAIGRFQHFLTFPKEERIHPNFSHLPIENLQNVMSNAKHSNMIRPFPLLEYLYQHTESKDCNIFDSEFVLKQFRRFSDNNHNNNTNNSVNVFPFESHWKEAYLWQFKGNSIIEIENDSRYELSEGESLFLTKKVSYGQITIHSSSVNDITLLVAHKFRS